MSNTIVLISVFIIAVSMLVGLTRVADAIMYLAETIDENAPRDFDNNY